MPPLSLPVEVQIDEVHEQVQKLEDEIQEIRDLKRKLFLKKDKDYWDLMEYIEYEHLDPDSEVYILLDRHKRKLQKRLQKAEEKCNEYILQINKKTNEIRRLNLHMKNLNDL